MSSYIERFLVYRREINDNLWNDFINYSPL